MLCFAITFKFVNFNHFIPIHLLAENCRFIFAYFSCFAPIGPNTGPGPTAGTIYLRARDYKGTESKSNPFAIPS